MRGTLVYSEEGLFALRDLSIAGCFVLDHKNALKNQAELQINKIVDPEGFVRPVNLVAKIIRRSSREEGVGCAFTSVPSEDAEVITGLLDTFGPSQMQKQDKEAVGRSFAARR